MTQNRFQIVCGCVVNPQQLYSLRLEDAMPHHAAQLTVQAVLPHKTAASSDAPPRHRDRPQV